MAHVNYSCPSCRHSFQVNETKRLKVLCPECGRQLEWYFQQDNEKCGPVSGAVIQQMLKRDELCDSDQVMQEGSNSWIVVSMLKTALNTPKPVPSATQVERNISNSGPKLPTAQVVEGWFYARDNQKYGPVSTEQLQQLANTGQLDPEDMIMKSGSTQWVEASTLTQLKFKSSRPSSLFVPCVRCGASISDNAQLCPQCGHPQPKLGNDFWSIWHRKESKYGACGVKNILEFFIVGDPNYVQYCRGCQRPLKETTEQEYIRHDMLQIYRDSIGWMRGGAIILGFVGVLLGYSIGGVFSPPYVALAQLALGIAGAVGGGRLGWFLVRSLVQWRYCKEGLFGQQFSRRASFTLCSSFFR